MSQFVISNSSSIAIRNLGTTTLNIKPETLNLPVQPIRIHLLPQYPQFFIGRRRVLGNVVGKEQFKPCIFDNHFFGYTGIDTEQLHPFAFIVVTHHTQIGHNPVRTSISW